MLYSFHVLPARCRRRGDGEINSCRVRPSLDEITAKAFLNRHTITTLGSYARQLRSLCGYERGSATEDTEVAFKSLGINEGSHGTGARLIN